MIDRSRREFLADVGRGMLVASLGATLSQDLGISTASAMSLGDGDHKPLSFGKLEPLVVLMQETSLPKLLPALIEKMESGTDLRTLTAAGALANARTFGGQDYIGYHTLMALAPAFEMSKELPEERRALPVLKVLYRNTNRIQEKGGRKAEVLHELDDDHDHGQVSIAKSGEAFRDAIHKVDYDQAERAFASLLNESLGESYNHLQYAIQDEVDVHRVVLSWRAYALMDLTGKDQAQTLLRQSVRYCVQSEQYLRDNKRSPSGVRTVLPKLLDQYKLVGRTLGDRQADDAWVAKLSEVIYGSSRDQAADAVAAALAEGMAPEAIGEAISLAANLLVLRDPGRTYEQPNKPLGSVHGDSVGVHASDSANAWRNIARVSNQRNTVSSLIVGAYHTAGQSKGLNKQTYPLAEHLDKITAKDSAGLLNELKDAIKAKEQARACALAARYGELGHSTRPILDTLLGFAVSEDGALHAEKYYRTVSEEFASTRPSFRWRQIAALARVTASEYGYAAPGYVEARQLLKV